MLSDKPTNDPFDAVDANTLNGWIHNDDSDGMRAKNSGQRLDRRKGN